MRWLRSVGGCLLLATRVSAQTPAPPPPSDTSAATVATNDAQSAPRVQFQGFFDIDYAATDNGKGDNGKLSDGFSLGYLTGHVSGALGGKFSFYVEVTVSPKLEEAGFEVDVARAILRYDYNDYFKISAGRYHAPVSYWNTAFHRGRWLQTTIFAPDIVKEQFYQPDHFMGVVAEGALQRRFGIGYTAGYGNGREGDLLLAGDAGGSSHHRAYVAKLFARPPQVSGVEFGGAVYHDNINVAQTAGDPSSAVAFPELITSGYVAITRETPEVIAEISRVRHTTPSGQDIFSHAYYVQAGYRIPAQPRLKPYARYEQAVDPVDEPVFGNLNNSKALVGMRFDMTDYVALKVEGAHRRAPDHSTQNGVFVQAAFTF